MISKRIRWALMSFALLANLLLSSCNSHEENTRQHVLEVKRQVALILKTQNSDFWQTVRTGAEAAAKEFNVELTVEAPNNEEEVNEQIRYVEDAINYKRDAVVIAANDGNAIVSVLKSAAAEKMPIVSLDTEVDSTSVNVFIGINHFEAGFKAGRKIAELTGGKGRIALIGFKPDERNVNERERGVKAALAEYPGIQTVQTSFCYSNRRVCSENMRTLMTEGEAVDGLVALHAVSSNAVSQEIEQLKLKDRVKVVTFDISQEDIDYLQEGIIQATLIQNPFSMGYLGVKSTVELLKGSKVSPRNHTGTTIIDQNNMFWSDNQKMLFPFVK